MWFHLLRWRRLVLRQSLSRSIRREIRGDTPVANDCCHCCQCLSLSDLISLGGGPGKTRTSDLRFRKPLLYPAELRDQSTKFASTRMCAGEPISYSIAAAVAVQAALAPPIRFAARLTPLTGRGCGSGRGQGRYGCAGLHVGNGVRRLVCNGATANAGGCTGLRWR